MFLLLALSRVFKSYFCLFSLLCDSRSQKELQGVGRNNSEGGCVSEGGS